MELKSDGIIIRAIGPVNAHPMVKINPIIPKANKPSFKEPLSQFFVKAYNAPTICNSKMINSIIILFLKINNTDTKI
jgi:hypothetical protein